MTTETHTPTETGPTTLPKSVVPYNIDPPALLKSVFDLNLVDRAVRLKKANETLRTLVKSTPYNTVYSWKLREWLVQTYNRRIIDMFGERERRAYNLKLSNEGEALVRMLHCVISNLYMSWKLEGEEGVDYVYEYNFDLPLWMKLISESIDVALEEYAFHLSRLKIGPEERGSEYICLDAALLITMPCIDRNLAEALYQILVSVPGEDLAVLIKYAVSNKNAKHRGLFDDPTTPTYKPTSYT